MVTLGDLEFYLEFTKDEMDMEKRVATMRKWITFVENKSNADDLLKILNDWEFEQIVLRGSGCYSGA